MFEDLQRFISQRQITEGDVFADLFNYVSDLHLRFSHDVNALYHARDRGSFKNSLKAKRGAQKKITIEESGLPQGARKLLALAAAVPAKKDARKAEGKVSFLTHVGN